MHPVLLAAEDVFRRGVQDYPRDHVPAMREVLVTVRDWSPSAGVRYSALLENGRRLRWYLPTANLRGAWPALRDGRDLIGMWDRIREEYRRSLEAPLQISGFEQIGEVDLRPGAIHYVQNVQLRIQEAPWRSLFGTELQERMRRDAMNAMMYDAGPVIHTTGEQQWLRAQEEVERLRLEERRRRDEADIRSMALLQEWLSPDERVLFALFGYIEVTGSESGGRYRIERGRNFNVTPLGKDGRARPRICFGPQGIFAMGDLILAQKIALETDEVGALAVANVTDGRGRIFRYVDGCC